MTADMLTEPMLLILKVTVIVAAGGLLSTALRAAPASVRHLVWATTLAAVLLLPAATTVLPRWGLPILPDRVGGLVTEAAGAGELALGSTPTETGDTTDPAVAANSAGTSTPPGTSVGNAGSSEPLLTPSPRSRGMLPVPVPPLFLLWALGTAVVLGWIGVGQLGLRNLQRRGRVVTDKDWISEMRDAAWLLDLKRPAELLVADERATPMTWGIWRPIVLLPGCAREWTEERRRMVLTHELAHIRRNDCLAQVIAQVSCAVFWFHPLVWYAAQRMRVERERACDDLVVQAGASAADYAAHLLEVARTLAVPRACGTAIAMARPSQLEGRLLAVLDTDRRRGHPPRVVRAATAGLVLLLAVPLAAMQLTEASDGSGSITGAAVSGSQSGSPGSSGSGSRTDADTAPASAIGTTGAAAGTQAAARDLFWQGSVPAGTTLTVHNWNGPIQASSGGSLASVAATLGPLTNNRRDVQLVTVEHAGGVTLCVLPEGARCTADGIRDERRDRNPRDSGPRTATLAVTVPEGVHIHTVTMNGALSFNDIRSNVRALTMNGGIDGSARGTFSATTMNGGISIAMSRTDWQGELEVMTMNGQVRVTLPDDASTEVSARTMAGRVSSDFPLTVTRRIGVSAAGTIGGGGRSLKLSTMSGSIHLGRAGGPLPGAVSSASTAASPSPPGPPSPPEIDWSAFGAGSDWSDFGAEMERFGLEMSQLGEQLGQQIGTSISRAIVEAFGN